ncbi:hypothetical protein AK830_g2088 [Neonectria ditissima]|uniref:Cas1p 10 TM acyl transferase domain-containing protein n=1 Tax=Neonectria ditissima TaxID=78410 RepID=A0A0P7BSS4_9HYPO|nr:hypothetical protein AK830_g2088 [Neonectria ditissima]
MSLWSRISSILLILGAVLFLAAVSFKTVFPGDDPYRCRAVARTGQWIDPPDEEGNRDPFTHWQPEGCILHKYSSSDIRRCLGGRRIVIAGDSTSRRVGYAFTRLLQRDEAAYDRAHYSNSEQWNVSYHSVSVERYPNAWLETLDVPAQEILVNHLRKFSKEKGKPPPIDEQEGPALVYIGAGVWFTNPGGLDQKGRMHKFEQAYNNLSNLVDQHGKDLFTDPMDPVDGVGNQVLFAPPGGPHYLGDHPGRIHDSIRRANEVVRMRKYLSDNEDTLNIPLMWSVPGLVVGQDHTWWDPRGKALHVTDIVTEMRANLALNLRCNARLDRVKSYPYERTCCTDYGVKPLVQLGVVYAGLGFLVACIISGIYCQFCPDGERPDFILFSIFNMDVGTFVLALLMCYYADRTQMMAKGSKVWSYRDFALLCGPCIAIALATIRRSQPPSKEQILDAEPDQPFLSRDQTDEWKGWMQFVILIYHWTNAQTAPVYVVVRLLVASYLFQTGYGHTLFFLNKKDYSFNRAAAVLLRLNLLSCSLAYFMNTDYMFYYFSPLVTFWFLVVYATMAIGKSRNDDVQFLLVKICISALLVSAMLITPLTSWLFFLLRFVFHIQWSYGEWYYRLSLDSFIVYVGMLIAVAYSRMEKSVGPGLRITLAFAGLVAICRYVYASSKMGMRDYKLWHPYISCVPVLAFVALRNVSAPVRNFHSKAMAWLGLCSLETYTLQFHLLLAADSKGVLIVDGFFGDATLADRWRSLVIILPIFLCISSLTATATTHIVKGFLHSAAETEKSGGYALVGALERIPGSSFITLPKIRIAALLIVLWTLNILSPSQDEGPAPDGFTPHRVGLPTKAIAKVFSTPAATPTP